MAIIEIEYSKLTQAASAAGEYRRRMMEMMQRCDQEMQTICAVWQGDDSTATMHQWNMYIKDSQEYHKLISSAENYENYINTMKRVYQQMQAESQQQAAWI